MITNIIALRTDGPPPMTLNAAAAQTVFVLNTV